MEKSFRIIKTMPKGLNVRLLAKKTKRQLRYSNFMSLTQGEKLLKQLMLAERYLRTGSLKSPLTISGDAHCLLFYVGVDWELDEKIVLHIREYENAKIRTFTFGHDETVEMMAEIKKVIDELYGEQIWNCYHCGAVYYADETVYKLPNAETIHRGRLSDFVQTEKAAGLKLPFIKAVHRNWLSSATLRSNIGIPIPVEVRFPAFYYPTDRKFRDVYI